MTDLLYRWPESARFDRPIAKNKLYEQGTVSSAVRERFITEVEKITWAYKLAEDTINLPSSASVPEIQVLVIEAKGEDVNSSVLIAIDKAIKQPIIFEITGVNGTRMAATPKQVGLGALRLGAYYSTGWMGDDATRTPLPIVINLPNLYVALLEPLTPVSARPGEDVSDVAARLDAVRRLEREVASLERKLRTEPQLNRKIELRRELQDRQAALASLI